MIHNTENLVGELLAILDNDKVILPQRDGSGQFSAVFLKLGLSESRKMCWLCGELKSQKNFVTKTLWLWILFIILNLGVIWKIQIQVHETLTQMPALLITAPRRPGTGQMSSSAMCPQTSYLSQWISPSLVWYLLFWCIEECTTVVIIGNDLLGFGLKEHPSILEYKVQVGNSLYNTPWCFSIYVMGLVLEWIENSGVQWPWRRLAPPNLKWFMVLISLKDSMCIQWTPDRSKLNIPSCTGNNKKDNALGKNNFLVKLLNSVWSLWKGVGLRGHPGLSVECREDWRCTEAGRLHEKFFGDTTAVNTSYSTYTLPLNSV